VLRSVIQEETTGCGIASVANILGKTYSEMKALANALGIQAEDKSLWSDTQYVRKMLSCVGVETSANEIPFESWNTLPDLASLSIKHHQEDGKKFWHWVVFKRVCGQAFVLDSASYSHLIFERTSMKCSPSGSSRSRMHYQAIKFAPCRRTLVPRAVYGGRYAAK
jgi:hypothetical protein